jgi:5'(3')-deoxyribonucleotidase
MEQVNDMDSRRMVRVAVDVDGVLADIISVWLENYNRRVGNDKILTKESVYRWDYWKELGYKEYEFYEELAGCWKEWRRVPLMEHDMPLHLRRLKSMVYRVDIVSAQMAKEQVRLWLEHNGIVYDEYVSVPRGRDKAYLDYDVFIDDSPINALSISSMGKYVILYDQPWNKHVNGSKNIRRAYNIGDVVEYIINKEEDYIR